MHKKIFFISFFIIIFVNFQISYGLQNQPEKNNYIKKSKIIKPYIKKSNRYLKKKKYCKRLRTKQIDHDLRDLCINKQYGIDISNKGDIDVASNDKVNVNVVDSPIKINLDVDKLITLFPIDKNTIIQKMTDNPMNAINDILLYLIKAYKSDPKKFINFLQSIKSGNNISGKNNSQNKKDSDFNSQNKKASNNNSLLIKGDLPVVKKTNNNILSISNTGCVSVGTHDDIRVNVDKSPISINFIFGSGNTNKSISVTNNNKNDSSQIKDKSLEEVQTVGEKQSVILSDNSNKNKLLKNIYYGDLIKNKLLNTKSCLTKTGSCLTKSFAIISGVMSFPFFIYDKIKGAKKEKAKVKNNQLSKNNTSNSDNNKNLLNIFSLLPGLIKIDNKGNVNVISNDKVNVKVKNSPVEINFSFGETK